MPIYDFIKEMRAAFADYSEARMPLEQRQAWAKRIGEVVAATRPKLSENVEQYVHACYECSVYLTSMNMGETRFRLCQEIIVALLPYLDAVPVDLAMKVVQQMSYQLDLGAKLLTHDSSSAYRNVFVEYRLRVWRRIPPLIDPIWKADDPQNTVYMNMSPPGGKYPSGIAPEGIMEPEIRQEYEKRLAENHRRAERNSQQIHARQIRDEWLKGALRGDMVKLYEKFPVTDEDWDTLKAYLQVYVTDAQVRQELYALCREAASRRDALGSKTAISHIGVAATQPTTSSRPAEKGGVQVTAVTDNPKVIDGEPLTIQVEMKNTLDRAVRLHTSTSHWQWRFQPPEGKGYWTLSQHFAEDRAWSVEIPTRKTAAMSFVTHCHWARGQECVFTWVGDEKKRPPERNSLPVGRYRLTIDMTLSTFSRATTQPEPWEGKLTTNPVEFEVVEKKP
jgi:hypothetical protein